MSRQFYGARQIAPALNETLRNIELISREIEDELAALKACPAACTDGTVLISPPSAKPRRMECPIVSSGCAYGSRLSEELDRHIIGQLARCGVPARHLDNFARLESSPAVSEARKWFVRGFLVLTGIPGIGKSFGALVAMHGYLRERVKSWTEKSSWAVVAECAEHMFWATAKEIGDDKAVASRCSSVYLLVLDDLGKEDATKTSLSAVCGVISKRYDAKKPTVITTELTIRDIEQRYGRYIVERIVEDAFGTRGGRSFDCGTESMRRKAAVA